MLSLLVFFALFGVFITQYVPLWMSQNENQYSNDAQASLEELKQYVDDQAIFGIPHTYAVPFTLSSQGIPLFAQPTQGSLSYFSGGCSKGFVQNGSPVSPSACSFQSLSYTSGVSPQNVTLYAATDYLEMQLPNRYYPSQNLFFEGDAVIVSQGGSHQWMLVPPPLNISVSPPTGAPSNVTVTSSLVSLLGSSGSFSGQGTTDVYSTLLSNTNISSLHRFVSDNVSLNFTVTFRVGTHNPCAWWAFLNGLVTPASGVTVTLIPNVLPAATSCGSATGPTTQLILVVQGVRFAQAYIGQTQISVNSGSS